MDLSQETDFSSDESLILTKQKDKTVQFMDISDEEDPTTTFSSSSSFSEITHISETTNSQTTGSCK